MLRISTVAPATAALEGSVTVPEMVPPETCAYVAPVNARMRIVSERALNFLIGPMRNLLAISESAGTTFRDPCVFTDAEWRGVYQFHGVRQLKLRLTSIKVQKSTCE